MQAAMTFRTGARALAIALLAAAALGWPGSARAELSAGFTGGLVFGSEEVTVKTYAPTGELDSVTPRERVSVNPGGIGGFTLTYWLDPASPWGVQAEAIYWANSLSTRGPIRRFVVDETRVGVLVTALGRYLLQGPGGPYVYGGIGGGLVYSRVSPGGDDYGPGIQALMGIGMMVTPNIRLRLELRYLVAPDIDPNRRHGDVAQTSGGGTANPAQKIFGGKLDTQFIPLMIGLDWVF
jgi:opacity protein-like surface antigen